MSNLTLVTGHIKSGKSKWAEFLFENEGEVVYIATSIINKEDLDMIEKIRVHKERRKESWLTIESKGNLSIDIDKLNNNKSILVDSLGGFISSNLNLKNNKWDIMQKNLLDTLQQKTNKVIIVCEQVGWGPIPNTFLGYLFMNRLTDLANKLELLSNENWLVVQGRALNLNKYGQKVPL